MAVAGQDDPGKPGVTTKEAETGPPKPRDPKLHPATLLDPAFPYTPQKTEPFVEIGVAHARDDFFTVDGAWGFHLGECLFLKTESCQQYLDGMVGWMFRDQETHFYTLASPRVQYVNFPSRYGSFVRLIGGYGRFRDPAQDRWMWIVGAGAGLNLYLHPNYDLKLEARFLTADRVYATFLIGVQIKLDRLLQNFARRLRDLGYKTIETGINATGETIRATGEGLEGVYGEMKDKAKKLDPTAKPSPTPTPAP